MAPKLLELAAHPEKYALNVYKYKCPICRESYVNRQALVDHFNIIHGLAIPRGYRTTSWGHVPSQLQNPKFRIDGAEIRSEYKAPVFGPLPDPYSSAAPTPPKKQRTRVPQTPLSNDGVVPGGELSDRVDLIPRFTPAITSPTLTMKRRFKTMRHMPKHTRRIKEAIDNPVHFMWSENYNAYCDHLLPYLALGFVPQPTPAMGNLCAIYALAISLQAVRNLNAQLRIPPEEHYSPQDLIDILRSDEYEEEVLAVVRNLVPEATMDTLGIYGAQFNATNTLELDQIYIIVRIINRELGTNFNIGTITSGYRGAHEFDGLSVSQMLLRAEQAGDPLVEWRRSFRSRADAKSFRSFGNIGNVGSGGNVGKDHEYSDSVSEDNSSDIYDDDYRDTDTRVGLDGHRKIPSPSFPFEPSVWTWNPDAETYNSLFIRDMNDGGPTIWLHNNNQANRSADQDFITNAVNHWEGLSPAPSESGILRLDEWNLYADIQLDLGMGIWRVTSEVPVFDTNNGVRLWPGYFLRRTRDLDDPVATRPAPANSLWLRTCGKRHYGWVSERNVEFISRNKLIEPGINRRNNFVIYRVVPYTSKNGRDGEPDFVDGFNLASGEFLLQVARAEPAASQQRVRDITGGEGIANTRSLQLCQNPWGLGQDIPRVRRNHPMGVHLPLARVLRQLKSFPSNTVTFAKDEIVLMIRPPETATGYAQVRDYEGKMGKIKPRNFEIIYDAFGIRLDPDAWGVRMQEMRDQHFTGQAMPMVTRKRKRSLDERETEISTPASRDCWTQ